MRTGQIGRQPDPRAATRDGFHGRVSDTGTRESLPGADDSELQSVATSVPDR